MPANDSPAPAVLAALGFAVFVRDASGTLRLADDGPEWLAALWPSARNAGAELPLAEASPFLENFFIDARECWAADVARRVESGPWIERDATGAELQLQARALTANGRACLLIERLGESFASQVAVLQKARETVIALQRVEAEIQKKEILVHCLADDLGRSLANIVTSLRLIETETNSPRVGQLLNLALRSAQEQRSAIDQVLRLFPEELSGLFGAPKADQEPADLVAVLRAAVEEHTAECAQRGLQLRPLQSGGETVRLSADEAGVRRVLANVLRIAMERSRAGSVIELRLNVDEDAAQVAVEFSGEFSEADDALRWRFCRAALAALHGEMGIASREGGASLWVRWPKWSVAK